MICDRYKYKNDCGNDSPISHILSCLSFASNSSPVQETQLPDFKSYQDGLSSWTNDSEANHRNSRDPPTRDYKR